MTYSDQLKQEAKVIKRMSRMAEDMQDKRLGLLAALWELSDDSEKTYLWLGFPEFRQASLNLPE